MTSILRDGERPQWTDNRSHPEERCQQRFLQFMIDYLKEDLQKINEFFMIHVKRRETNTPMVQFLTSVEHVIRNRIDMLKDERQVIINKLDDVDEKYQERLRLSGRHRPIRIDEERIPGVPDAGLNPHDNFKLRSPEEIRRLQIQRIINQNTLWPSRIKVLKGAIEALPNITAQELQDLILAYDK